jgi:hypothetical protein
LVEQIARFGSGNQNLPMLRADELLCDRTLYKPQQSIVKPLHIQQTHRFLVKAEVSPGGDFAEFFEGAEAAGQA